MKTETNFGNNIKFSPGSSRQWLLRYRIQLQRVEDNEERLILRCFGASTEPLLLFIMDAEKHHLNKHGEEISILMAEKGSFVQKYSSSYAWRSEIFRPGRPMSTVYMDPGVIDELTKDVEKFFLPETAVSYREKGIPYRRGYLFHGIPRSGKTTTVVALATQFKLGLRVITLNDRSLDDAILGKIFDSVPSRCIVLLEDVDTSGMSTHRATVSPGADEEDETEPKGAGGVSLSGLLNAIDGVFSPQGYILIMTTNHKKKLDPALIGPGRVDHEIEFKAISTFQASQIFGKIFEGCPEPKLTLLAEEFSKQVNELEEPVAAIQNYLMGQAGPESACQNLKRWAEERKKSSRIEKE